MASKSEERQFLARESPEDLQVARTEGSFLFDDKGRQPRRVWTFLNDGYDAAFGIGRSGDEIRFDRLGC